MKNGLFVITSVMLCLTLTAPLDVCASDSNSGKCGKDLTWSFDVTSKTLTIDGTGEMYDFESYTSTPWTSCLLSVQRLIINEGVETIGNHAFQLIGTLKDITIPDSVTSIGDYAFCQLPTLETVTLSRNTLELGDYAFYQDSMLSQIDLPEGLKSIGENCFNMTFHLANLNIPDSVTEIGYSGLTNCAEWYCKQTDEFMIVGDGILYQFLGTERNVTVPDEVQQISGGAFCMPTEKMFGDTEAIELVPNQNITGITLSKNVHDIPPRLFAEMKGLQKVMLPSTLTSIGNEAFSGCVNLTTLKIPSGVTEIGRNAFFQNPWLKSAGDFAIVGDGILYQFQGRQKIVTIPETVKIIGTDAISGNQIMELRIPETVTEISPSAINCKKATIAGVRDSAAEAYAMEYSMPFTIINAPPPSGKDMTLDFTKDIWSFGNSSAAFGSGYYLTDADRAHLTELGIDTENMDGNWSGSCVGLSVAVILAKNGVVSPAQLQADAQTLNDVTPDKGVQSFINYYQYLQGRTTTPPESFESAVETFYRMTQIAANVKYGESPFLLTFALASGSHGVVGYGQGSGEWEFDGKRYDTRILVWDSNYPTALHDASCLYYDSATFDYCIPQYGVHVADNAAGNVGGIITVCNDLSVLNAYPYPREESAVAGDVTNDGQCNAQDVNALARWLTEEDSTQMIVWHNGDCNHDGKLTGIDLTLLKRMLL